MTAPHQNLLGTSATSETTSTDSQYNSTVLLVRGNGTNGSNNNSFVDSSSHNQTITTVGEATQGTVNPFLGDGQYSVFFDDASDITIAHSSEFNAGTGAFTLEGFVYLNSKTDFTTLYSQGYTNAGGILLQTNSGDAAFRLFLGSGTAQFTLSEINLHEWVHIAIVRDGSGNVAGYINGVQDQTKTGLTGDLSNTSIVQIGKGGSDHELDGYINSLRFIKGTNKYQATSGASNFTVPTTPFTDESGTSFLVCQSNRFIDNSTTGHTLTTSGTPKVVPFSPFLPTASYSESVHGGSGFFGGGGNLLQIAGGTNTDFNLTSNAEWCIEFWVYMINPSSNFARVMQINHEDGWAIRFDSTTGKIGIGDSDDGSTENLEDPTALPSHQWTHFAFTNKNQSGTYHLRLFRNGVQVATTSGWSQNWTNKDATTSAGNLRIAAYYNNSYAGIMYLGTTRLVQGDYIYDSTFTPPTGPLTSTGTGTKLLLNFTNGSILDETMKNNLITAANAQIDTSNKKFGTGSLEMDGADDDIRTPNFHSSLFDINTGPFTIEFFVYVEGTNQQTLVMLGRGNGNTSPQSLNLFRSNADVTLQVYEAGNSLNTNAGTVAGNQWVYVVLQRDTTNMSVYIDGTRTANFANSTAFSTLHRASIGSHLNDSNYFNGFIDELRITLGLARYSGTSMTVPTTEHPTI